MDPFLIARLSDDSPMTDVMIDIETTGTDPYHNAMIQLAAIQFNYETQEIGSVFNHCLRIPAGRYWDEDTREWWGKQKAHILQDIYSKMQDPRDVTLAFNDFICSAGQPLRFWSRGSFDWWFVQSYFDWCDRPMPFAHNAAMDLRAFQSGLFGKPKEPDMSWLTHPGDAHNALYDCVLQLKRLFSCANGVFYEITEAA